MRSMSLDTADKLEIGLYDRGSYCVSVSVKPLLQLQYKKQHATCK